MRDADGGAAETLPDDIFDCWPDPRHSQMGHDSRSDAVAATNFLLPSTCPGTHAAPQGGGLRPDGSAADALAAAIPSRRPASANDSKRNAKPLQRYDPKTRENIDPSM
jgi:hypothetical protein